MITRVIAALIISVSMAGTAAAAGGDPAAGQQKSQVCAACHGADGNGENTDFPIIAGQYADYMVRALMDYKSGVRNNAVMKGIASGLSTTDMEDLAAYFSIQKSTLNTPSGR